MDAEIIAAVEALAKTGVVMAIDEFDGGAESATARERKIPEIYTDVVKDATDQLAPNALQVA